MTKISLAIVLLLGLSACAASQPTRSSMNWDSISGTKVAKVNNIKSLITPGFY